MNLQFLLPLPVDVAPLVAQPTNQSYRKAIRTAVRLRMRSDPALKSLFGGEVRVSYRPTRRNISLPSITIFDSGSREDNTVPLFTRSLQIDVWAAADLDLCEDIANRVEDLLDHQPLLLPDGEGRIDYMALESDVDVPTEDADLDRKTLIFRLFVYRHNAGS